MADIEEGKVCTDLHSVINAHYIGALLCMNKIAELTGRKKYCNVKPIESEAIDKFV